MDFPWYEITIGIIPMLLMFLLCCLYYGVRLLVMLRKHSFRLPLHIRTFETAVPMAKFLWRFYGFPDPHIRALIAHARLAQLVRLEHTWYPVFEVILFMVLDVCVSSSSRWRYDVRGKHNLRDLGYPDWMENENASPDFVVIKIKDPQRICLVGEGKPKSHLGRPRDLRRAFAQVRTRLNKMAYPNPETL